MGDGEHLDPDDPLGLGGIPAGDEVIDVVASAGPLDPVVATLREFLHRSGAVRAIAVLPPPQEGAPPSLVDCARLAPIEVTSGGHTVHLPHAIPLEAAPLDLGYDVRQLPPFEVHPQDGRIAAPLGGVEHYGHAVRALAAALGDEAVALVTFATSDPEAPLSVTARSGDPMVLSLGDEEYEMEPGWPDTPPR